MVFLGTPGSSLASSTVALPGWSLAFPGHGNLQRKISRIFAHIGQSRERLLQQSMQAGPGLRYSGLSAWQRMRSLRDRLKVGPTIQETD